MSRHLILIFFVWGVVLIAISLRLYFYSPVHVPRDSQVKLELTAERVSVGESSVRIDAADVIIFAPRLPQVRVGDRIIVEGKVDGEGRILNPEMQIIGHSGGIGSALWDIRQKLTGRVERLLPPREATLVVGTVLGVDKIGGDFKQELVKTGTIHVVVVSGQNLAIVAGIFLALSKYLSRRAATVCAILACFVYAVLTGFEPPVVRALFMIIATTLALFFGRATTALISLFFAAAVIIFIWPDSVSSISFQLTFGATLGIVTIGSRLQQIIKIPVLGEIISVCVGAFLATAPVILYHFGSISLLSPLVNVLVSEAIFPIMILGFLLTLLSLIFIPAAQIVAYLVYIPAHYFVEVVRFFAKLEVGTVEGFSGNFLPAILLIVFLLGVYFIWRPKVNK